jgi:hypothetical protein
MTASQKRQADLQARVEAQRIKTQEKMEQQRAKMGQGGMGAGGVMGNVQQMHQQNMN